MQLIGKQIYLRPLRHEDAQISWRWRNDVDIWQFTFNRPDRMVTLEMEEEWIDKVLAVPSRFNFAICLKNNDQYIGNVYLTEITDETAGFGIFLGEKSFWGRGIGTETTKLMLDYAFSTLKMQNITLMVKKTNVRAISAYRRCGFDMASTNADAILMKCQRHNAELEENEANDTPPQKNQG